jgi:ArsR family transcriptional regulator
METKDALRSLAALAQDSRLAIFRHLVEIGPDGAQVGQIGAALALSPATLSFHLKELANAGLVTTQQEGRYVRCAANFAAMNALLAYLTDNCCGGDRGRCAPACPPAVAKTARTRKRIPA